HPLGLRHLHENLRQGIRGHDVILDLSRHFVRLLRPFVFICKASYHISTGNSTKSAEILLTKSGNLPPLFHAGMSRMPETKPAAPAKAAAPVGRQRLFSRPPRRRPSCPGRSHSSPAWTRSRRGRAY